MGKQPTDSINISKEKMREGFKRALSNCMPVLKNIDDLDEKYPGKYKEEYPENWTDPLELYGCYLEELHLTEEEKARKELPLTSLSTDIVLNGFGKIECGLLLKLFIFVIIFKRQSEGIFQKGDN
jgi:hypothetical protein